jgi:hypothetical protein
MQDTKPKPPSYNTIFNKLERPKFQDASSSANINFILDTIDGQPVTATDSAKVFFIPQQTTRISYRSRVNLMAKAAGLNSDILKYTLIDKNAIFDDGIQKLTIDISNFNFNYEYLYDKGASSSSLFTTGFIPQPTDIENIAVNFLQTIGRYPEELATGRRNTVYYNYNVQENKFYVTKNPNEANVAEVDFYRPDIDSFTTVSPKYFTSKNYVIMAFSETGNKILKSEINFFEKSEDQIGIYPVKSGNQAYEDLKSGRGFVVSEFKAGETVKLKQMFMGYYDQTLYQPHLQPVYVFLGENNFAAYVPALTDEWYSQ